MNRQSGLIVDDTPENIEELKGFLVATVMKCK
jgi:hypothetical protein